MTVGLHLDGGLQTGHVPRSRSLIRSRRLTEQLRPWLGADQSFIHDRRTWHPWQRSMAIFIRLAVVKLLNLILRDQAWHRS